ncbi:hypothetical protein TELCIR_09375 [Teladorsagia circumcincta]|uniref:Bestrophin homolog n=1 Tax=Teladorsagia circumcincta TaxID=45464 RepID=A0A2G9UEZ9_TELCI|nr:hypothetical protein TELCIR_09375 [Teladorsagia circumcincta]
MEENLTELRITAADTLKCEGMTITYTLEVSRARFWGFAKLLTRWKGSIYRLMYREMTCFLLAYYAVMVVYRYFSDDRMKKLCLQISAYVQGGDVRGRMIRRSMARYVNLISALTFQRRFLSSRFRNTIPHFVDEKSYNTQSRQN